MKMWRMRTASDPHSKRGESCPFTQVHFLLVASLQGKWKRLFSSFRLCFSRSLLIRGSNTKRTS